VWIPDPVHEPTTCGVARLTVPLTNPAPDPIQVKAEAGIVSSPERRSSAARTVSVTVAARVARAFAVIVMAPLPVDPLIQVGAAESPLPSDPDCRQFTGLDQPVNRPRIQFQTAQHLFSGQEGSVGRLAGHDSTVLLMLKYGVVNSPKKNSI
jgi:hypothetical protein